MRAVVALALLVLGAPARAEPAAPPPTIDEAFPPTLRIGEPRGGRVERVAVAVRSAPAVTWIALELGDMRRSSDLELPVDVPAGAQVVGMTIQTGASPVLARMRSWQGALYDRRDGVSPAVLAWAGESAGEQHLVVRAHGATRIEIAVALPALATLRVDAGRAKVTATIDGVAVAPAAGRAPTLDLRAVAAAPDRYPHVDDARSLFADTDERDGMVVIEVVHTAVWIPSLDASVYRRTVRAHLPQLRQCYMAEAQRDPTLAGDVLLQLVVADDGTTSHAAAAGVSEAVATCVADAARQWTFPALPGSGATVLNYPLTFHLNR